MNKLGINFTEKTLLILQDGQRGTQRIYDIDLDEVRAFAPKECRHRSCLMWNFDDHTCTVCEDYVLTKEDREAGAILSETSFVERQDLIFPCDTDYHEFIRVLGMEEVCLDVQSYLASLFGSDGAAEIISAADADVLSDTTRNEPADAPAMRFDQFLRHDIGIDGSLVNAVIFGTANAFHTDYWKVTPEDFLFLSEWAVRKFDGIGAVKMAQLLSKLEEAGYSLGTPYYGDVDYVDMPLDTFLKHFTLRRNTFKAVVQAELHRGKGIDHITVGEFLDIYRNKTLPISDDAWQELTNCFMAFGL